MTKKKKKPAKATPQRATAFGLPGSCLLCSLNRAQVTNARAAILGIVLSRTVDLLPVLNSMCWDCEKEFSRALLVEGLTR